MDLTKETLPGVPVLRWGNTVMDNVRLLRVDNLRLKVARAAMDRTQEEMALLCRVGLRTWNSWERGKRKISGEAAKVVAEEIEKLL